MVKNMGRQWAWFVILLLVATTAYGEMCQDTIEINTNCTMLTPSLRCTAPVNYSIYNSTTGNQVEANNLTILNADIYYFNFTLPEGGYIIRLCDATTREVRVKSQDVGNMSLGVIIILPMLLGLAFLISGFLLDPMKHQALRLFLFLLTPPMFWTSVHYGVIALIRYYNIPDLVSAIAQTTLILSWVYVAIVSYFFIFFIYDAFTGWRERKKTEKEYGSGY
jgi:hypothetical protein